MSKKLVLNDYLRSIFKQRVQRIPLNPFLGCPNRDKGAPCIYCDENGSSAPWIKKGMSIKDQLDFGSGFARGRYKAKKFIAYFQAFTTTYASSEKLEKLYEEAISYPGVVGISISTRPDCLNDDVLNLLEKLSKKTFLWIELGAQSMFDKSLNWIKRGHNVECFKNAVKKLKKRKISVVGHIIFGLPSETKDEMLRSFKMFLDTGINGYKIHMLHVIKGTKLEEIYKKEKFKIISMDEYVSLVKKAINFTPNDVVIHRVTAEVREDILVAPMWILNKNEVYNKIFT
jgi:uncharacterized protein